MSDRDRLAELEHHRAALAAHLAWLDREIARERGARPPASPADRGERPRVQVATPFAPPMIGATDADDGPAVVVPLETSDPLPSKSGCWIAFTALLLGLLGLVSLYVYFRYGRG